MEYIYPFDIKQIPNLGLVGGKANSLIMMTQNGLPVPPGFVLTVNFFQPWFEQIKETDEWQRVMNASVDELRKCTDALKNYCTGLRLDDVRKAALAAAIERLERDKGGTLFAVRSSSPEEDLEGASFAGGYETTLGVQRDAVEEALLRSFASSLDERVFLYKKEHGFSLDNPRIAVIVQLQVPSETAGVAFSLNPINNCYDEMVINANFGLGESVVSGLASPDTYIADKTSGVILERKAGKKETSIWLDDSGGTYEKTSQHQNGLCLNDEQVIKLIDMLRNVENYYNMPMDIEWAYEQDKLYLLQARPITAYIPLPEKMQTKPGEQKLLYLDETTVKQGINEPISVMGTDLLSMYRSKAEEAASGKDFSGVVDGLGGFYEGRMYLNISNNIKLGGKGKLTYGYKLIDKPTTEIIAGIDEKEYVPEYIPGKLKGIVWGKIKNGFGIGVNVLSAIRKPEKFHSEFVRRAEQYVSELKTEADKNHTIKEFVEIMTDKFVDFFMFSMPVIAVPVLAQATLQKVFKNQSQEVRDKAAYIGKALPHNITTEMGFSMYRLSQFEEVKTYQNFASFYEALEAGLLSEKLMEAWLQFVEKYGFRCPKELDIAAPRYYEQPEHLFNQLKSMSENSLTDHNPQAVFERTRQDREKDYQDLLRVAKQMGKGKADKVRKSYNLILMFGGYRETPKYYWIMTIDAIRKKVLEAGSVLTAKGCLDHRSQVFDLTMDDLESCHVNPSVDLRAVIEKNTAFLRKLKSIKEFPRVIDSRGKILYPPKKKAGHGELIGDAISPGIAKGRIKVLHRPDEKPILPGDILVASATDPGWTPLFINAAGVILEVGGMLQHGALVAREYGKPCVSGIENAVSILKDGQMVEVDGLNGTVKLL